MWQAIYMYIYIDIDKKLDWFQIVMENGFELKECLVGFRLYGTSSNFLLSLNLNY